MGINRGTKRSSGAGGVSVAGARLAGRCIAPLGAALHALPPAVEQGVGDSMGLLLWLLGGRRRHDAAANFAALLGASADNPAIRRLARQAFKSFGRMSVAFFTLTAVPDADILSRVDVSGYRFVDQALERGRGVILALPHLGSWDLAARVGRARGYPLTAVAESGWGAAFVEQARADMGVRVVTRERSLRPLLRALARNEAVVLISDVTPPGARAVEVAFAGQHSGLPEGPARLAVHSGAPIVPCTAVRFADGSGKAWASAALYPSETGDTAERVRILTSALAREFDGLIRQYPEQWYAFRPLGRGGGRGATPQ